MALSTVASSSFSRSAPGPANMSASSPSGAMRERQLTADPVTAQEVARECSSRTVAAAALQNGTALPLLAQEHCNSFQQLFGPGSAGRLVPDRRITIGTACTGSAADILSFQALELAYQEHVPGFEVAYTFNCEMSGFKRKWGKMLHGLCPGTSANPPCWFKDISLLHTGTAACCQHNKPGGCPVQAVDIFVCATSCKDFSKANPHKQTTKPGGESARTLSGMLKYLDMYRPPLFLFENVDSIDDTASGQSCSDMDIAMSNWASIGYECQRVAVNSKEFGIPASRSRMLVVGVQTIANAALDFSERPLSAVFTSLRSLIRVCQRTHSCASEVLLPSNHVAVLQELARRQDVKKTASGPTKTTSIAGYNIAKAMDAAMQRGVQWGSFGPPPGAKADAWFNTLTKQQQDAVSFSLRVNPDDLLFRDVSQSLGLTRLSTRSAAQDSANGYRHCAAAVLPNQMMMVFTAGHPFRLLLGREALVLQGFPSEDPSLSELIASASEAQMADLAGNMVSTPILLALAMAAISSVSWKERPRAQASTTAEACAAAWSLFQSLVPSESSELSISSEEPVPNPSGPKRQRR